jgi:hypothetical protein
VTPKLPELLKSTDAVWLPEGEKEGARCTINGAPGRLVRDGDWLICRPLNLGPSRSDTRTQGMSDAQRDAYLESIDDLSNAWRSP